MHQLPHELLFYRPNWGQLEMQKGQKIEEKHAESWGRVCWALGCRRTAASLLFSIILFFYFASFLLYSLWPYFFTIL
jgi:hypothetical protein